MSFGDALTKASRLVELQLLFGRQSSRSFSTSEIARHLGIAERTARNYINEMSVSGRLPVYREGNRWRLQPDARIEMAPVSLLLEEAAAVYLAARLLCRHSDEPNPAVRGAISRLAKVVPADLAEAMNALTESVSPERAEPYDTAFRTLANAWALRREVELDYHPLNTPTPKRYRFRPYLLEPAARGFAVYAIGHADPPGELRVFKMERVISAQMSQATFEPPPIRDLLARLDSSWGVYLVDAETVEVRLRFSAEVGRAVRETCWHRSQQLVELSDGGTEVRMLLAPTVELVSWILGWGATCEVLVPESLRSQVASILGAAASLYQPDPSKARS